MSFSDIVGLFSRWLHILSAITLLGTALFATLALKPARLLHAIERFSTPLRAAVVVALASGLYNLLTKPALPHGYHAVFGVKFLVAVHVLVVCWLAGRAGIDEARRGRWVTGVVVSGLVVTLLSAYLRYLVLR